MWFLLQLQRESEEEKHSSPAFWQRQKHGGIWSSIYHAFSYSSSSQFFYSCSQAKSSNSWKKGSYLPCESMCIPWAWRWDHKEKVRVSMGFCYSSVLYEEEAQIPPILLSGKSFSFLCWLIRLSAGWGCQRWERGVMQPEMKTLGLLTTNLLMIEWENFCRKEMGLGIRPMEWMVSMVWSTEILLYWMVSSTERNLVHCHVRWSRQI